MRAVSGLTKQWLSPHCWQDQRVLDVSVHHSAVTIDITDRYYKLNRVSRILVVFSVVVFSVAVFCIIGSRWLSHTIRLLTRLSPSLLA